MKWPDGHQPANRVAVRVIRKGVDAYRPALPTDKKSWSDSPIPHRVPSRYDIDQINRVKVRRGIAPIDNPVGKSFGRLTVLGLRIDGVSPWNQSRWVCRCVCGAYQCKGLSKLASEQAQFEPMCQRCLRVEQMRTEQLRSQTRLRSASVRQERSTPGYGPVRMGPPRQT